MECPAARVACNGNTGKAIKVKRAKYRDNFFMAQVICFLCGIWHLKLKGGYFKRQRAQRSD
jgi:hypothetical protein